MGRHYPDRRLIAERLYNGIIQGKKFVYMCNLRKSDYKRTYFKRLPYNEDTETYLFGDYNEDTKKYLFNDYFIFTNPKIRKIIDIIKSLGFSFGKNKGNYTFFGYIFF